MQTIEILEKIKNLPKVDYVEPKFSSRKLLHKNETFFREMIQKRINHCEEQLLAHLNEAKIYDELVIVWKTGHFSLPVYKALKASQNTSITEWNNLIWEQVIRQMGREQKVFNAILWDIASEGCIC